MSETRSSNDDVPRRDKSEPDLQDLAPEALTPEREAKVKGGLGSIKEGLTSN